MDNYNSVMVFAIHQHALATGRHVSPRSRTPLAPPSPLYPSELLQTTSFGCPAPCIELAVIIYFTHSTLFSQITPLSPSPPESRSLSFTSVSPLLPHM